jgi:hypothetical protein
MIGLRAWWVLGLVLSVSGCAGTNRRPARQPAPPMLGMAGAGGVRDPALARGGPAADEVGPETRRVPRILSRYFPGLSRRGTGTSSPAEARPADDDGRPLSTASAGAAARRRRAAPEAAGGTVPLLSVAIDVPAPPAESGARSPRPAEVGERLTSLETAPNADPEEPSGQPESAEAAEPDSPPPLAEVTPAGAGPIATDPDADPVLAGRPRLRRLSPVPPSGPPTDLPAATFPRTYYRADSPPVVTRVSSPGPTARPRRPRWPRLFLPERSEDAPAASVRSESDDVPQRG